MKNTQKRWGAMFANVIFRIFSFKKEEFRLLAFSMLFIFVLFASYAMLRPIRDALGINRGSEVLKWLFLGTFFATLLGSFLASFLSGIIKRKNYINAIFYFFALNLLGFFAALLALDEKSNSFTYLSWGFYIWLSVFNIFVISSAWSLLVDIFSKENSKRLFGIICAGASLGGIVGAALVSALIKILPLNFFIFISLFLLLAAVLLKNLLIKEALNLLKDSKEKSEFEAIFTNKIGDKNPLSGLILIFKSKQLLLLMGFIFLLTSVSTFLYMEQARIIQANFATKEARIAAFANIDLIVQSASLFIQIFLTSKIARFGLKWLLAFLGFVIGCGFIMLNFTHPAFLPFVVVMSLRRIGEYALIKPGREMLFVPLSSDEKYKVKNFLDTSVYRGGDALSAQLEGALAKFGISVVLLSGAAISFLWGILGLFLARVYEKKIQ